MSHYQHLIEQLKQLRLGGLVDSLELRLQEAEKQQLSYLDFLSLLIQDELERRSQSKFARRLKKACFSDLKTLEEFDFKFNPAIDRRRIYDLGTCHFLENKGQHLSVRAGGRRQVPTSPWPWDTRRSAAALRSVISRRPVCSGRFRPLTPICPAIG